MKRVFTIITTLALLCACLTPSAFGAEASLIYALAVDGENSVTVKTGDVITITYTIYGSRGYDVNAIQNEIKFDASFFALDETSITAVEGMGHLVQKIAGPRVYMNDVNTSYTAEQLVGSFRLKVIASSGSSQVESTDCLAYDGSGSAMPIILRNLTVTIADDIRTDVKDNGDGTYTVGFTRGGAPVTKPDAPVRASIPAADGNVVLAAYGDGTQAILGKSLVENGAAYFLLDAPATVRVIDNAKNFADVASGAWYKGAVDFVSSHALFHGVSASQFAPETAMNRAMLVTVLYRLEGGPRAGAAGLFSDVKADTWYTDAVAWAGGNQIVEGYGGGLFGPEDNVTREQMAAILYRYMKYLGMDVSAQGGLTAFPDGGQVSSWAMEGMRWAVGSGILEGKDVGTGAARLDPLGAATRAETSAMLMRLVGLLVRE